MVHFPVDSVCTFTSLRSYAVVQKLFFRVRMRSCQKQLEYVLTFLLKVSSGFMLTRAEHHLQQQSLACQLSRHRHPLHLLTRKSGHMQYMQSGCDMTCTVWNVHMVYMTYKSEHISVFHKRLESQRALDKNLKSSHGHFWCTIKRCYISTPSAC